MQPLADIPSPSNSVWHLGPLPIRAYALMIIIGIVVAVWVGERRWVARGGTPNVVVDVAVWAVPFGLVGGRLYHVITDYQRYFVAGKDPIDALKIWEGGLGIWGAIVLGGVGAWIGCRRRGVALPAFADAVAPGIALAQAIGRWGNWWNQELFGRPTNLPWAVRIDPDQPGTIPGVTTYHPTFLYESLWCIGVAVLVIWAGRRFKLTHGRAFALYVAAYTVGRFWIEALRIDDAHHVLGLRLNDWTALVVFLGAVAYLLLVRRRQTPERVTVTGRYAPAAATAGEVPSASEGGSSEGGSEEGSEGGSEGGGVDDGSDEPTVGEATKADESGDAADAEPSTRQPTEDESQELPAKGKS
jgi:phosphatidylglycerol---prolipoprotein diacylglyceryl transferase